MSNELSSGEKTFLWTLGIVFGSGVLLAFAGGGRRGKRHRRRFHRRFIRAAVDAIQESLVTSHKSPVTESKDVN